MDVMSSAWMFVHNSMVDNYSCDMIGKVTNLAKPTHGPSWKCHDYLYSETDSVHVVHLTTL